MLKNIEWWSPLSRKNAARIAVAVTIVLAIVALFVRPTSWPHDDWDHSLVLMQRFGENNVNNYINVCLGWLFKGLCQISMQINWFFWLRWVMTALSFGALTYAVFAVQPLPIALAVDGLIKLVFWQVCFVDCNFTRNAGLFAATGLVLLVLYARGEEKRWAFWLGLLLWLMGALWRPQAGLLAIPFGLLLLAYHWLKGIDRPSKAWPALKQGFCTRRLLAGLVGALIITVGTWGVQAVFWSQPIWARYEKFNWDRSYFTDYHSAGWESNEIILRENGFSENDYWCMEHQTFADPEFFNPERMEFLGKLRLLVQPKKLGEFWIAKAIPFLIQLPFKTRSMLTLFLIGGIIFLMGGWRERVVALASIGGSLLICLGLLWHGYLPQWVMEAVSLGAIAAIILLPPRHVLKRKSWLWCGAAVCVVCLLTTGLRVVPRWGVSPVNTIAAGETDDPAVNTAATDKEHVYFWDTYSAFTRVQRAYGLCALPDADFFTNNTILGGYHEYAPYMIETRRAMGAENPMRALVENPDALLVDDYMPENILLYVQQHYAPQAALSAAKDMGGGLWALALTTPLSAEEVQPLRWEMDKPEAAGGRKGWYAVTGHADGLEKADALWLKIENRAGESRCYRLVDKGGGTFGTGYYLDWTEGDGDDLAYTFLWQQDGKIYESMDKK